MSVIRQGTHDSQGEYVSGSIHAGVSETHFVLAVTTVSRAYTVLVVVAVIFVKLAHAEVNAANRAGSSIRPAAIRLLSISWCQQTTKILYTCGSPRFQQHVKAGNPSQYFRH